MSFARQPMDIEPPHEFSAMGLTSSGFKAEVGPFTIGTEVLWRIISEDRFQNTADTSLLAVTIAAPPATQAIIDNGIVQPRRT